MIWLTGRIRSCIVASVLGEQDKERDSKGRGPVEGGVVGSEDGDGESDEDCEYEEDDEEDVDDLLDEDSQAPGLVPDTNAKVVGGRIELFEEIGQGAMGRVFHGYHLTLKLPVAVKALDDVLQVRDDSRERFRREAQALSRLHHPGIVRIYELVELKDNRMFLCMELLKGRTLHEVRKSGQRFPPAQVINVGVQLCDALQCAHAEGILHRDLSGSNVMLLSEPHDELERDDVPRGRIKVFDWGLCKYLDRFWTRGEHRYDAPPGQRMATPMGARFGTPEYMAPELLAKGSPGTPTPSTDVYAAGVVLFGLLTAGMPFRPGNRKQPRAVAEFVPDFACPELEAVIRQAIEYNPATRTQTMKALRAGLERARVALDGASSAPMVPFRVALEQARKSAAASTSGALSAAAPAPVPGLGVRTEGNHRLLRMRVLDLAAGLALGVAGTLVGMRLSAPSAAPPDAALLAAAPESPQDVPSDDVVLAARPEGVEENRQPQEMVPTAAPSISPAHEPRAATERPLPTMRDALEAAAASLRRCSAQAGGLLFVDFTTAAGRDEFVAVAVGLEMPEVPEAVHRCVAEATRELRFKPTEPLTFTEQYMP